MLQLNFDILNRLAKEYGPSFYLLDSQLFHGNFIQLRDAFRTIYPKTQLAYSYKTNYTPTLCKIVDRLGGFAEVVSDMEYEIARRIGVQSDRIIFNGPSKGFDAIKGVLLLGGIVNLDSFDELPLLERISSEYPGRELRVGIRCNFDIGDGLVSRFGLDVSSGDFDLLRHQLEEMSNVNLVMLHCHFATRSIESWQRRIEGLWALLDSRPEFLPPMIDLGGGLFGNMPESLKRQFTSLIPSYRDYAELVAGAFSRRFGNSGPMLVIEPGTAVVGDVMYFVTEIVSIKRVRKKSIATLNGSVHNINPTLNGKNLPLRIVHTGKHTPRFFEALDFAGYTCIESDYLYKGYSGECAVGDYVVFGNVGSYSVVLKPPFILPNFPIIEFDFQSGSHKPVKRAETFDDVFHTYVFP